MNQCEETEKGVHPSETPLCGQHDNQTKAQSPDHKCSFRAAASVPVRPDFRDSSSSVSKKVATADRDSFWSSDSGLGSRESLSSYLKKDSFRSSDSGCVSSRERTRSYHRNIDFKKNPDDKCAFRSASLPVRLDFREADGDSVLSSDSWREEKTSLPTIQEFDVGSSAGMETKSTDQPLFGTLHLFDRGKEMVIRLLGMFRRNKKKIREVTEQNQRYPLL